jgi:hypothetical protein
MTQRTCNIIMCCKGNHASMFSMVQVRDIAKAQEKGVSFYYVNGFYQDQLNRSDDVLYRKEGK